MAQDQPSLQRLLAIDKDFSSFDEQLNQATQVLGRPEDARKLAGFEEDVVCYKHNPRAEWVFRWLLGKLKSDDTVGARARASAGAWQLLKQIALGLPASVSSKSLNANAFLASLEKTLRENFIEPSVKGFQRDASAGQDSASESSGTVSEEPRSSRKRKRHSSSAEERATSKRPALEPVELRGLFEAVSSVLVVIATLAFESSTSNESSEVELVKSVLRTNTAQAARLLKLWLETIHYLTITRPRPLNAEEVPAGPLLERMLQIWNTSFSDPAIANSSPAEQFSQECLIPAVVLLSDLAKPAPIRPEQKRVQIESQVVSALETLLARHVFIPCRGTFFAEVEGHKVAAKPGQAQSESPELRQMLAPLHSVIQGTGKDELSSASLGLSKYELLQAAGALVDIAIRCSQRSTPKKRIDEAPWLQHAFVVLCECIGTPVMQRQPGHVEPDCRAVLEQMLATLQKRGVSLDSDVLETIIRSYSGIIGAEEGSKLIDQQLVARILAYDPTGFMDSATQKSKDNTPVLSDALFDSITELSSVILDPPSNEIRDLSSTPLADETPVPEDHNLLKDSIVIPLLKAYANSRDLDGFLSRWYHQLNTLREEGTDSMEKSIWAVEDLGLALRELLEASFTPRQLFDHFNEHWRKISGCEKASAGNEDSSSKSPAYTEASASLVVLDALVGSLRSDDIIASLTSVLGSLQRSLFAFTGLCEDEATDARTLRIIYCIQIILRPHRKHHEMKNLAAAFFKWAETQNIVNVIKSSTKPGNVHTLRKGKEAFTLIVTLCNDFLQLPDFKDSVKTLFLQTAAPLFRSNDAVRDCISSGQEWHPTDSPKDQAIVFLESITLQATAVLTKFPDLIKIIPFDSLQTLLRLLYWHAFGDFSGKYRSPNLRNGINYVLVFEAISDILLTSHSSELKDLLYSIVFEVLDPETKLGRSRDLRKFLCEFSESQFLRMPLATLIRKDREQVLDRICDVYCSSNKKRTDVETQFRHLSLMIKLMEVPNATSRLANDPDLLWKVARATQEHGSPRPDLLRLVEELVRLTLMDAISVKTQSRGQQYLKEFSKIMQRVVKDTSTLKDRTAELACFKSALNTLKTADTLGDEEETYKIMKRYLRALDHDIENHLPGKQRTDFDGDLVFVRTVLDAVAELPTQGLERDVAFLSIESKLQKCTRGQQSLATNASQDETSIWVSLSRAAANVSIADNTRYFGEMVGRLWSSDLSIEDRHTVMKTSKKAAASLGPGRRASLLSSLISTQNHERPSPETLFLLNVLVPSLQDAPVKGDSSKHDLLGLGGHLATNLPKVQNVGDLQVMLNCIDTILREKQWLVSQWAVENLIDSLCRLASASGPALPANYSDSIYTRICNTTHLIIALHRTRLGGRYHVLMPLLQNLLRCLFTPDTKAASTTASTLPPWLNPRTKPLTTTHAAHFARLVTTLCNPTVAAVSKHRPRASLVDETKKAREYAGQYVPAIIVQFCACALQGRIGPEVRAALMPALYACADVVGIEALRAMNAGMDASARAIWRGVYSDWKKFGKWDGGR
ncbi:uncharacterized protein K452DRAFT_361875 [Aplosporella prunicola CBS 121167]|uniref:Nucleolar 27S pre-rRNA processing Urb2/Npa2 C-terminal domain-containing protein n=1 Tax=Aplosporella prunicola CBS 121167 TaxID=1176127 RepID=A0A6A6B2S6_9PEZI|nr:uncharacterized protein K452DRAFT_361875 [Aplosporella prunicola CBS 121167]KAF2137524.1 hypothetical protein K452DRAFT_361875 [Aplosporella prunicola CBS 121167]